MKPTLLLPVRVLALIAATSTFCGQRVMCERIYIMNGLGYNQADQPLIDAIVSLGHTVDVSAPGATSLPSGFLSTCLDPENGYHWLCFFGSQNYTALIPGAQAFINAGGKVLLQYEVSCCVIASQNAATMASAFTGLTIEPGFDDYIAHGGGIDGWECVSPDGCIDIAGSAYKCMNGIPAENALLATANLNGSLPLISQCPNFGFVFAPEDLPGGSGGLVGLGDVNLYYDNAGEPPNNGGTLPVDLAPLEILFGSPTSTCTLLPMGCLSTGTQELPADVLGILFPNPANDHLIVPATVPGTLELTIHDAIGKVVVQQRSQGEPFIAVPTNHLPAGVYHLSLRQNERQEAATFVVEH